MKIGVSLITALLTVLAMNAQKNIPAIDVHSHIVTNEYIKYLADNNALMADGYPLPSWDVDSHLAFMDSAGIGRSVLTLSSPQAWFGNLSKLYYDLAGGPSVQAIKILLTVTTPNHIMFGTDYPFVPTPILEKVAAKVKNEISQDAELGQYAEDIFRNNAERLFKKNEN